MSWQVLQILNCDPNVRIARSVEGETMLFKPVCLSIVRKGMASDLGTEVKFMELVDNEVQVVDTKDSDFLRFVDISTEGEEENDSSSKLPEPVKPPQEEYDDPRFNNENI